MESNPFFSRIGWYLIMLGTPLILYGIIWIIYWLRNYYSEYVYTREIREGHKSEFDSRMPILYLRNFSLDGSRIDTPEATVPNVKFKLNLPTLETRDIDLNKKNLLRRKVSPLGPLISIGDENPYDIGINRTRSSNTDWQNAVEKHMRYSRMIILRTSSGITSGIKWELDMILDRFLNKSLFYVENSNSELNKELNRQLEWKFPTTKQKLIEDLIVPYYFWVTDDGKKNYTSWLRNSSFFRKLLKDSRIEKPFKLFIKK